MARPKTLHAHLEAFAKRNERALNLKLAKIARDHLHIATLETRNRDALDFHDVSVAALRDALEAAYQLGRDSWGKKDS